jgi:hypothetical protein
MNAFDEDSRSLWMDTVVAEVPALEENRRADTVVVGSGIAGLSTAYELACRGQKVLVLDRGRIAGGMTARTSAHLTSQSDDGFKTVIKVRGLEGAKTFYETHAAAIDRIEGVAEAEDIECHFRRVNGYLFPAIGKDASQELNPELEATKTVGMPIERILAFRSMAWKRRKASATPISLPFIRYAICAASPTLSPGGAGNYLRILP